MSRHILNVHNGTLYKRYLEDPYGLVNRLEKRIYLPVS
jgi:hypothetical protein